MTTWTVDDDGDLRYDPGEAPVSFVLQAHYAGARKPAWAALVEAVRRAQHLDAAPVAWISPEGLANMQRARREGHSHYTVQVRLDRADDYNTIALAERRHRD
jgi:hypothetical protein